MLNNNLKMSVGKGKLVILAGIDGSGKSTLLSSLAKKGYCVSHWKKLENLSLPKALNFRNPGEMVQTLDGSERLEFIWSYINFEWEYLIKPVLESGRNIIADRFFIGFFIKEKIYKRLPINKLRRRSPLTGKEFIIMIDTPPEIALKRKTESMISPYEYFKTSSDFIPFQLQQRKLLLKYVENFPHVIISGMLSKEEIAEEVVNMLKKNQINP